MRHCILLLVLGAISQTADRTSPVSLFATMGLSSEQIGAVDAGRPVAKVLSWGGPSEVYVFGAVHVDGSSDVFMKAARDVGRLARTPGYLGVGELHPDATVADLAALVFDPDDVKALKNCREGACEVQLPAPTVDAFRGRVDWSRPDATEQVNAFARSMMLQLLRSYEQGGNKALGEYRDRKQPAQIADQFETMMGRAAVLPDVLPELRRYLLEYPNAALPGADSYVYWEKVDFGLKPTIRVNHAVIYRGRTQGQDFGVVAIKQLYASHYFHTALDVSVCIEDRVADGRGFYLLTVKGSQQEGLTGVRGSLLRKIVVDKTRTSLERALAAMKQTVEQSRPAAEP